MAVRRHGTGQWAAGALALLAAATPATASDALVIEHQPVHCLLAGKYPRLDACVEPLARVARARVYFRAEGVGAWYYVEMKPEDPCFSGVLPRPKKSLKRVSYYLAVTDRDFAEARTEEYTTVVVPDGNSCSDGIPAPFLTSASVVVGGAAALPSGFVGGGILAGVGTAAVTTGVAVVGAGAAAAVIAGGGGEEPSPTTEPPAPATTTTTTTLPTTTTTTTLGGCGADSAPPEVEILSPAENADVGAVIDIVVEARDPGPVSNGILEVRVSAEEQGGSRSAAIATLPGPGPTFRTSWALPSCLGPQDRWYVDAEATDGCGRDPRPRAGQEASGQLLRLLVLGGGEGRPPLDERARAAAGARAGDRQRRRCRLPRGRPVRPRFARAAGSEPPGGGPRRGRPARAVALHAGRRRDPRGESARPRG